MFFIELGHREGEFAVGVGRRTFTEGPVASSKGVDIEWFERKSKNKHNWGKKPSFRLTIGGYDERSRRPFPSTSRETLDRFIPIVVKKKLTPRRTRSDYLVG